jgi:molybdenum cofactor cytidylyltransferase
MIFALIPAAGQSARMGRPKLALPLGGRTVLECVIVALRAGGVEKILVVCGPHAPELVPLALNDGAQVLALAEPTPDMRATIEHGLAWAGHEWRPSPEDAFLLVPADHPAIDSGVVKQLTATWCERPKARVDHFSPPRFGEGPGEGFFFAPSILIPTYQAKRGHPTLIAWKHVPGIRALSPDVGLNRYLRDHAAQTLELPVESDSVLIDLDTPEDYKRLLARYSSSPPL